MKSNNTQMISQDNSCAMISSIFTCKLEAVISVLTERGCSSQTLTEQSRCRERAACTLILRRWSSTNDHRDSLKFVQEVARFVTSRFFLYKKKVASVRPQIFFSRTIEKLGRMCDQIGHTLEPCCVFVKST